MADSAGGTPRATLHNGDEGGLVAAARGMGYGTGGRVGVFFRLGALQEPLLDPTPPQNPTGLGLGGGEGLRVGDGRPAH